MRRSVWLIAPLLLIFAMSSKATDIDAATKEACTCVAGPYAKLKALRPKAKALTDAGNWDGLKAMQGEINAIMDTGLRCLEKADRNQSPVVRKQIRARMKRACPPPRLNLKRQ